MGSSNSGGLRDREAIDVQRAEGDVLAHMLHDQDRNLLGRDVRNSNLSRPPEDGMVDFPKIRPVLQLRIHVLYHGLDVEVGAIANETEITHRMPQAT